MYYIMLGISLASPQDQPDSNPDILTSLMKELQLTQTRTESQPAELPIASVKGHGLQSEPAQGFVSRGNIVLNLCLFILFVI